MNKLKNLKGAKLLSQSEKKAIIGGSTDTCDFSNHHLCNTTADCCTSAGHVCVALGFGTDIKFCEDPNRPPMLE